MGLDELGQQLQILDGLANQERPAQRENWRRKLKEMRSEREFVQQQVDRFNQSKYKQGKELREREELLARRSAVSRNDGLYGCVLTGTVGTELSSFFVMLQALPANVIDAYAQEGSSLVRSQRMVGEYLASGQTALASLADQRQRLKGVQRRVLDIANIMGVSNSLLRMSERRTTVDKLIVYGGMLLISGLLYWAWCRAGRPPPAKIKDGLGPT